MSQVSVSVPSAWLENAAHDLVVVNTLKQAGIPADFISNGIVHLTEPGTLTKTVNPAGTTFTWTPVPPALDPKDATITELNGKVEAAAGLINDLQKRATTAESVNTSLQTQVNASTAQISELKTKIAIAESSLAAAQASAESATAPAASSSEPTK